MTWLNLILPQQPGIIFSYSMGLWTHTRGALVLSGNSYGTGSPTWLLSPQSPTLSAMNDTGRGYGQECLSGSLAAWTYVSGERWPHGFRLACRLNAARELHRSAQSRPFLR
jgi:hypothetical protein